MPYFTNRGITPLPVGGADSAELTQFTARISAPSAPRKAAYAALIDGLVADGVWTLLDALYILAAATAATARTNLKQSSYGLTANGIGLGFTADLGYIGDAATGYLDTAYDPSTVGGNFPISGNTGMMAVYTQSAGTAGFVYDIHSGGNVSFIAPLFAGGIYANIGGSGPSGISNAALAGNYVVSRTSAAATQMYKNGATAGALDTSAPVGGSVGNITLLANSSHGTFSDHTISAAAFGAALDGTKSLALMSRINTYMTALSINVY